MRGRLVDLNIGDEDCFRIFSDKRKQTFMLKKKHKLFEQCKPSLRRNGYSLLDFNVYMAIIHSGCMFRGIKSQFGHDW